MRSPLLVARLVFFAVLFYLNVLGLGFAIWTARAMTKGGSHAVGPPLFLIFNACALFLFMFVALAEMVSSSLHTASVRFECGWTAVLSILHLAAAVDNAINGPPVYCHAQAWMAVCASSTVLVATAWSSSVLLLIYFLTLLFTAISHQSTYGAIWTASVYNVPWFVERQVPGSGSKPQRPVVVTKKAPAGPYESPVFRAHEEEEELVVAEQDMTDVQLSPPIAPFAQRTSDIEHGSITSERSRPRVPPSPTNHHASFRPSWAKRIMTRRGIDPPFYTRPQEDVLPPPVPRKAGLPPPAGLNGGFLDIPGEQRRLSYDHFPQGVPDPDRPVGHSPLSQWVRADDSPVTSSSALYTPRISPA